jgi:hypothetical protein
MVIGLFSQTDLSDHANPGHTLPHKNFNLPKFHDNLFRLGSLGGYLWSPVPDCRGGPIQSGRLKNSVRFARIKKIARQAFA